MKGGFNSNDIFFIIIVVLSALLLIPNMNLTIAIGIALAILIGYSILKNILMALALAFILGNIFVSLYKAGKIHIDTFENYDKKQKHKSEDEEVEEEKDEEESKHDKDDEYFIDSKGSFTENIKSLSPKEIAGLNDDTKKLIETQKQLIETLQVMGPQIKQSKTILDSFKNYFGDDDMKMDKLLSSKVKK